MLDIVFSFKYLKQKKNESITLQLSCHAGPFNEAFWQSKMLVLH